MNSLRTLPVRPIDARRLTPHLANYNTLCDVLAGIEFSPYQLEMLIALEIRGKKRRPMVKRLLGKLHTVERDLRLKEIEEALA